MSYTGRDFNAKGIKKKGNNKMNMKVVMAGVMAGMISVNLLADTDTTSNEPIIVESHVDLDKLVAGIGPKIYESGEIVTNVRNYAFAECRQIETIRAGYAQIVGIAAFRGCVKLTEVDLPLVTTIVQSSPIFAGCINLVNVYLPMINLQEAKAMGFPWQCPARAAVFHFKDGDYDKNGRKL